MPVHYRIDSENRRVISTAFGSLTDAELLAHQTRLASDPSFDSTYDQLYDFSSVSEVEISAETIKSLASGNPFGGRARRAFVASIPIVYGLARMFIAHADLPADRVCIVATKAEAISWLDRG